MVASFRGFRSLIEHSPDAIALIDPQGEVLYASPSTQAVLGYQPEELIGRNGWDLIHPEDRGQSAEALRKVISEPPGPIRWHPRVRCKDGTYSWVESTVSNLLVEPDVQAIVLNHRNINARRAAEAENHRFANQLTRAKLETEEFARTVAHGLREPLRTVSALTSVLMQSVEMQSGQREIAEMIVDGVARMTTLVEDLLVFATAGMDEQPQPVDLAAAAAEATRNLDQVLRESGARILIGKLPKAYGNAGQLTRLFQNLIDNAVRHCGGKRPRIEVFAELQWPDWVISVKDHGAGIAPPDQIRVFQPFVRLSSRDVPGTGLGLAVCKEIVENMGGVIWVESNLGAGSTFSFTIAAGEPNPAKLRDP